jgi:CRP-like cAMP-binding protein
MFQNEKDLVNILFSKMELEMYDPEEHVIRQGEVADKIYFISKGEIEVWV